MLALLTGAATGDGSQLVSGLLEAADDLEVAVQIVDSEEWPHGDAKGVCKNRSVSSLRPLVEAKDRPNEADLATTLIHEYAHSRLHFDVESSNERTKRELEAEAVAYVVGRYSELDTENSAFYLAAWTDEDSNVIQDRLERISRASAHFIEQLNQCDWA